MGASISGIRPRDWDPDLVSRLADVSPDDPNLAATARLLLCHVALDQGELAAAEAQLLAGRSAAESGSPIILSALGRELAYLAAILNHGAESARRFRDLGDSAPPAPHQAPPRRSDRPGRGSTERPGTRRGSDPAIDRRHRRRCRGRRAQLDPADILATLEASSSAG